MAEFEFNIRDIYRILRRRKWVLVISPILVGALTYFIAPQPSPTYQAEALVKISRVAANMQALLIEALSYYQGDNIETQSRIITSQLIKVRVARGLARLGRYPEFGEIDPDLSDAEILADRRLVDVVEGIDIAADRKGDSDIVGITSLADSEALAVDTANISTQAFIQYNRDQRSAQIEQALAFIQQRIRETESGLTQAEQDLRQFKSRFAASLILPESDRGGLSDQIDRHRRTLSNLNRGIEQLERISTVEEYLSYSPFYIDLNDSLITQLERQLLDFVSQMNKLRSQQRNLLQFQTEQAQSVVQNKAAIEELQERVQETIQSLLLRYKGIRSELQAESQVLQRRIQQVEDYPETQRRQATLEREVELKAEALGELQKRLQDAEIQKAGEVEEISLVESARTAIANLPPTRWSKVAVGLILGLLMGGVFAFILESLDTSIGTIEGVESYLKVPVLGVIPHMNQEAVRKSIIPGRLSEDNLAELSALCSHFAPGEPVSEACRTMRTHLDLLFKRNKWKTLLLTSSVLQEGKSTTSSNLAVVFAQSGLRTLLIDADLRRPQVHKTFGLERSPGLSDILLGVTDWDGAIRSIDDLILGKFGLENAHLNPGLEYLFLLSAGRSVDNPSELLGTDRFRELLQRAAREYDFVIVDVAPVMPVADASVLAPQADATLLAYQIGRVSRDVVFRSKTRLDGLGANVVGIVMNDIEAEIDYYRGFQHYDYSYQYGPETSVGKGFLDRFRSRRRTDSGKASRPQAEYRPPSVESRPARRKEQQEIDDVLSLTRDKDPGKQKRGNQPGQ